jgi:hypothetical protein
VRWETTCCLCHAHAIHLAQLTNSSRGCCFHHDIRVRPRGQELTDLHPCQEGQHAQRERHDITPMCQKHRDLAVGQQLESVRLKWKQGVVGKPAKIMLQLLVRVVVARRVVACRRAVCLAVVQYTHCG